MESTYSTTSLAQAAYLITLGYDPIEVRRREGIDGGTPVRG
jgi:hypothetical protein